MPGGGGDSRRCNEQDIYIEAQRKINPQARRITTSITSDSGTESQDRIHESERRANSTDDGRNVEGEGAVDGDAYASALTKRFEVRLCIDSDRCT